MSSGGPVEAGLFKIALEWAWAGVAALVAAIWKKHNDEIADIKDRITKVDDDMNAHAKYLDGRIDSVERNAVPLERYEQNRKEVREGQIAIYERIGELGQSLARIEGKLGK